MVGRWNEESALILILQTHAAEVRELFSLPNVKREKGTWNFFFFFT